MSNIDKQIKELQLKKKKIDYISYIADLVKNDTKCIDFKEVKSEVVSKIEPFLLSLMTSIETDTDVKSEDSELFTDEQKSALRALANKLLDAKAKPTEIQNTPKSEPIQPQVAAKREEPVSNSEKMNFAMNNRHLADKRVQVINDTNAQVFGKVVGLDAPHVVVKTETGPIIRVPIEKVVPV